MLGKVDVAAGGDLAGDDRETGRDERLAGDAADGVLREDGVENGVGDLVGDLVGMAFGHRLRGEQITAVTAHVRIELLALDAVVEPSNWYHNASNLKLLAYGVYLRGWNLS